MGDARPEFRPIITLSGIIFHLWVKRGEVGHLHVPALVMHLHGSGLDPRVLSMVGGERGESQSHQRLPDQKAVWFSVSTLQTEPQWVRASSAALVALHPNGEEGTRPDWEKGVLAQGRRACGHPRCPETPVCGSSYTPPRPTTQDPSPTLLHFPCCAQSAQDNSSLLETLCSSTPPSSGM